MRIHDNDKDTTLKNVTIFLTYDEMRQLEADLHRMVENRMFGSHEHIDDSNYEHEITIALYKENERNSGFSERANRVLIDDE
jgi:hypothetical protein